VPHFHFLCISISAVSHQLSFCFFLEAFAVRQLRVPFLHITHFKFVRLLFDCLCYTFHQFSQFFQLSQLSRISFFCFVDSFEILPFLRFVIMIPHRRFRTFIVIIFLIQFQLFAYFSKLFFIFLCIFLCFFHFPFLFLFLFLFTFTFTFDFDFLSLFSSMPTFCQSSFVSLHWKLLNFSQQLAIFGWIFVELI
jgi:hypothetical protein